MGDCKTGIQAGKGIGAPCDALALEGSPRILLHTQPVDFRKAVNGLSILLSSDYGCNPGDGGVYIFYNGARDRLKILYYQRGGFVMVYKRLEKARFKTRSDCDGPFYEMDDKELGWLLAGLDFSILKAMPEKYGIFA